ncbi:MAG TPA: N-acetylneuraminate synthase family protein [Candidatus Nanoarchaeia archaeon]|nr:N-acetylneuraminate synthase family protein [Candidatus Nanoarchaeia archaeon]
MKDVKIGDKIIGKGHPVFVIAETASSHVGNKEKLKQLIKAAIDSNADAINLQKFYANELAVPQNPQHKDLAIIELKDPDWKEVLDYAKTLNTIIIGNPFDESSVDFFDPYVDAFKIHSTDINNPEMLMKVAKKNKPMFLGIGGAKPFEIKRAIKILQSTGNDQIVLMHGFQAFPTRLEDSNLKLIPTVEKEYNLPTGFLDHIDAETKMAMILPLLSVVQGAVLIEKHITLDRKLKEYDYFSALHPSEFKEMMFLIRETEKAIGHGQFIQSEGEIGYNTMMKKNLVAKVPIKKDTILTKDMITFKRARVNPGPSPIDVEKFIGKSVNKDLNENDPITLDDLNLKSIITLAVRMKSSRLPRKALAVVEDQTVIEHLIDRMQLCKVPSDLILCTSTHPDDAVLIDIAKKKGIKYFAGSEDDVMDRFIKAALPEKADIIVRVTGDNIFTDPEFLDETIKFHIKNNLDYSLQEGLPIGCISEVITLHNLIKAHEATLDPENTEYMTYYLRNEDYFKGNSLKVSSEFNFPNYRLTIDNPEDLQLIQEIFKELYVPGKVIPLRDILNLLNKKPELLNINKNVQGIQFTVKGLKS